MQAGRHTRMKVRLSAISRSEYNFTTEQKVAASGLITTLKKQLAWQHWLRHQITAQLTPLLLGENIQRGETA